MGGGEWTQGGGEWSRGGDSRHWPRVHGKRETDYRQTARTVCREMVLKFEFYMGQFSAIQKHQTRERVFYGLILFLYPCWELNL